MNDITQAMAQAGIKLPTVKYRIWQWVKDHPVKTAAQVKVALKLPEGTVSAALFKMAKAGYMESVQEPAMPGGRPVAHYCVTSKEYTDRPRAPRAITLAPVPTPIPQVVHKTPPLNSFDPEKVLGDCTLKQLREVQKWVNNLLPANA